MPEAICIFLCKGARIIADNQRTVVCTSSVEIISEE